MLIILMFLCVFVMIIFSGCDIEEYNILPGFGFIICIVMMVVCGIFVSKESIMDDKIAMYEEENSNIEDSIGTLVKQYMEYEGNTFSSLNKESAITLVSLYPELKTDKLVEQQMDVYIENNKTIKHLKEEKINISIYKWWLYFGGRRK